MEKRNTYLIWFVAFAIVAGYFLVQYSGSIFAQSSGKPQLKVVFCDVGQGDATYIRTPEGQDILIDGGPDDSVLSCLGKNMPYWDREIDLVMFSHPEADHISGLIEVLRRYKVDKVIWSGLTKATPEFYALKAEMDKTQSVKLSEIENRMIEMGNQQKVKITFYYPFELPSNVPSDVNDLSMVEKVSFGSDSILFTGDIMQKGTKGMLTNNPDLKSEVLKIPHHGSKNGLTPELLSAVSPQYAVIPVGLNNSYGHPHQIILDLLLENRVKIYRTDKDGQVTMTTSGIGFTISTTGK